MDNKPPFRPPSTDGISPGDTRTFSLCRMHKRRFASGAQRPWRFLFPEESYGSRPSSSLPLPSLFSPLSTGLKRSPNHSSLSSSSSLSLSFSLFPYGRRRRILLEFSSSRKVDNSRTAPVRGKPRIRSMIYYIINFKYVIFSRFTKWMKNIRMIAITRWRSRREIRRVNSANASFYFTFV